MSNFAARARSTAAKLISTRGMTVVYVSVVHGVLNPVTQSKSNLEVTSTVKARVENYNREESGSGVASNGALEYEKKITLAADLIAPIRPRQSDKVRVGDVTYTVMKVKEEYAEESVVYYELLVRQAS